MSLRFWSVTKPLHTRPEGCSINCVAGDNRDNPTELTTNDLQEALQALLRDPYFNKIEKYYGFFVLCPTNLVEDVKALRGFFSTEEYAVPAAILSVEFGSIYNLRFLKSNYIFLNKNGSVLGNDIYRIPLLIVTKQLSEEELIKNLIYSSDAFLCVTSLKDGYGEGSYYAKDPDRLKDGYGML